MTTDRGKPNDWAAKYAAVDAAAKAIIDQEASQREAKTARLKALREAQVAPRSDGMLKARGRKKVSPMKRAGSQRQG
ncbi:hypothetical protein GCM10007874_60580 [Labrys miyagiensis]|uniref:Transcriptional regulator n=1 Tax=Labrys miyagiensis TaxID=346912 RepID=A0ABQ6CRS6_9HYPH|nr:hypothetical protein [Labrys miyagiensis]GLS23038.1 hypothetical protein GCM10007874_60580 [Labrys miyagiensis]